MARQFHSTPRRTWIKRSASILLLILLIDVLMFGTAGRLDWLGAWLFTGMYLVFLLFMVGWSTIKAPGLMEERSRRAANVKAWDKVILNLYTALFIALLIIAGLDAGRFRWSTMPPGLQATGAVLLILSGIVIWRVMAVNYFLSRYARIQDDRGQHVVSEGPYHFVRHPMYAALIPFMPGMALLLGSWWALIPAGLIDILFIVRTCLEDRMLKEELPGYQEYAQKVRHRLIPGIW
jgi:protein-S-isoprenylcysteine O-methyltransferase Ste14